MRSRLMRSGPILPTLSLACAFSASVAFAERCAAQELEPRRWSHLPTDTNFLSVVYGRKDANIDFDPALRIENATQNMNTLAVAYSRTFELLDMLGRVDVVQAWNDGKWAGVLDGAPASTERQGFSDTRIRFSANILGSPPLKGQEYAAYRASAKAETIVGVGLAIELPTGEYNSDKLINLGNNRFAFAPQIGIVHSSGDWSLETTGSVSFFTGNDSFIRGNTLDQDPLQTIQAHLTYNFTPRLWSTASTGFQFGGETSVNGEPNHDRREDLLWGLTAGYALTSRLALKISYLNNRHQAAVGSDFDTLWLGVSTFW